MELSDSKPIPEPINPHPDPFFDALDDFPFYDSLSDATWLVPPEPEPSISDKPSSLTELENNLSEKPKEPAFRSPRLRKRYPRPSKTPGADHAKAGMSSGVTEVVSEEKGNSGFMVDSAPEVGGDVLRTRRGRRSGGSGSIGAGEVDHAKAEMGSVVTEVVPEEKGSSGVVVDGVPEVVGGVLRTRRGRRSGGSGSGEVEETGFLVLVAGLVIRAVSFQISLLAKSFSVPIWLLYHSFMFMYDPSESLKKWKCGVVERFNKLWSGFCESFAPYLSENKSFWDLVGKFGWGVVWVGYVCFMLFGFIVIGFVMGGVVMRCIVEEPIQMTDVLNFDYTDSSPVALVDIMGCRRDSRGLNYMEMVDGGKNAKGRVFPLNHKVQLTVSLILPESEYNRKLGIFQVRADFLSDNGKVTDSSRRPVMLHFKSHLIRYLETFLKTVPLLTGYSSESQVLKVVMRGFRERHPPTSCIRIVLEQRAEYRSGAGIPEIYGASVRIESELPLIKRIIWYWKTIIFIWVSMVMFFMQLAFALLCCRPLIIPRARPGPRESTVNNTPSQRPVLPRIVRRRP